MRKANLIAIAGFLGVLASGASAQTPCSFTPYGPACGPIHSGTDVIAGGLHNLSFDVSMADAGAPVVYMFGGVQTALPLPNSSCQLLTLPVLNVGLVADPLGNASLQLAAPGNLAGNILTQVISVDLATQKLTGSNGLQMTCGPTIFSVSPPAGAEGTVITITGTGFDPNPANTCVFLGGQLGSATVISASPTTLVAIVRAVHTPGSGPVEIITGVGMPMPPVPGPIAMMGRAVVGASLTSSTVSFALTAPSPGTLPVLAVPGPSPSPGSAGAIIAEYQAPSVGPGSELVVDVHLRCADGHWVDICHEIVPTSGPLTGPQAAVAAANHINMSGTGLTATADAAGRVQVRKENGTATNAFGSVTVR